jgi:hypothetical protein
MDHFFNYSKTATAIVICELSRVIQKACRHSSDTNDSQAPLGGLAVVQAD